MIESNRGIPRPPLLRSDLVEQIVCEIDDLFDRFIDSDDLTVGEMVCAIELVKQYRIVRQIKAEEG